MNQDFITHHHRGLIASKKFAEAREYKQEHDIQVDWNHVSRLFSQQNFNECLDYIKGFYDPYNPLENDPDHTELHNAHILLESFLFVEDKENHQKDPLEHKIRKLFLPSLTFVSKKFEHLAWRSKSRSNLMEKPNIVQKKTSDPDYNCRLPFKKRFLVSEKHVSVEPLENFMQEDSPKKRKKENQETIRERIIEVLEALNGPTTWEVLKELIPGDKTEIWKVLNKMIREDVIELNDYGTKMKGRKACYYYELSPQQVFRDDN